MDTTNDAALRHAKGPHNVDLAAGTLADQLGRKHPEGTAVVLGVLKYRIYAAEVRPLAILAHDAHGIADAGGTVGDQRQ